MTVETIILKSHTLRINKINRKTQAKMFKDLKVGDKVEFSVPIKQAGSNRGTYATYIIAENISSGARTNSSFNQMPRILDAFEFEENNDISD